MGIGGCENEIGKPEKMHTAFGIHASTQQGLLVAQELKPLDPRMDSL